MCDYDLSYFTFFCAMPRENKVFGQLTEYSKTVNKHFKNGVNDNWNNMLMKVARKVLKSANCCITANGVLFAHLTEINT